jgi:hypothetical protein
MSQDGPVFAFQRIGLQGQAGLFSITKQNLIWNECLLCSRGMASAYSISLSLVTDQTVNSAIDGSAVLSREELFSSWMASIRWATPSWGILGGEGT